MALDREKYRKIVGGITTPPPPAASDAPVEASGPGQGRGEEAAEAAAAGLPAAAKKRFAKTGRPKGRGVDLAAKVNKVKVSLFLDERLVNELYEWAHQERLHPGELFDRALRAYRDREAKRRNAASE